MNRNRYTDRKTIEIEMMSDFSFSLLLSGRNSATAG
jgi:hypothetical protein